MDTVIIVLKVGLIVYAIYSFVVYASRRSGNKSALKGFRDMPVLRRITDEERSALQPFLMGQGLTVEDDVRELGGAFVRHGLQSQGSSTEHDTIGDVDVLLPYDAIEYVEAHNQALVVLSKKCAVVIRVNGFDLLEGRQRAQRQQAQDAQWKRGEPGALPSLDDVGPDAGLRAPGAEAAASVASDPNARYKRGEVVILNQRAETPEEVESRVGRGSGWGSALVWLLAFALLWLATWDATRAAQAYLLGAGLLAGLCAAWLFVRRPAGTSAERHPQQVNRVRGMLNEIAVVNAGNVAIKRVGLFLGDKLSLVLPSHWAHASSTPYGEVIEAELRAGDCSAVSFGDKWSVADEWRRFRPAYWGRHLLHLLVGLLALAALALSLPDPRADLPGDLALVAQSVFHEEAPAYTGAAQLAAQPPKWGSRVSLKGEGRCEIDMAGHGDGNHTAPAVDCSKVRWNGQAPVVSDLKIPESIVALGSPDFIRASENGIAASLMAMLRMQLGQGADPLAAYRARESVPMVVRHFDRTVATVDAACKDSEGLSPGGCRNLQQAIVNAVEATVDNDGTDTPIRSWAVLAASAAPDKENADLVLTRSQLATLQRAVRQSVDGLVAAKIEAARPAIVPARGGVVLVSTSPIGAVQRQANEQDTTAATDADASVVDAAAAAAAEADVAVDGDDTGDTSLLGRWARLQRNAAPEGVKPFVLAGLVTASDTDGSGAVRLHVDPHRDATQVAAAGAHTLWWAFGLALVLINGVWFALRFAQDMRRRSRLHADVATRPAPGATGLF